MRTMKKFAVPCFMIAIAAGTASADMTGERRTFSFDNGNGLYGSSTHSQFTSRHGAFLPEAGTPVSRFFVHRNYGASTFHYGGTASEDEHHHYGGVTVGNATLAYFQGEGERFSKAPNSLYDDLNQYFFHGGSRSSFELSGVAANIDLPGGFSTQFAATDVSAPNVQDRHGYYTGISSRRFRVGVSRFERGSEKVGDGLNLGIHAGRLDLEYQEIASVYDARVRRVALAFNATPVSSVSLELEQASNDAFARDDEQRIMLRFRKRLGVTPAFNATDNGEGDEEVEKEQTGFGTAVGIGVGLGVGAIALSSGSSDNDGANRFSVRNNAAFTVFNQINPVSVQQNREHGGWIFRNADNTFGYTQPIAGGVASINLGIPAESVPMGTVPSASYHTHGGPDPRFDNENFSSIDIQSDRAERVDGYLGTPAGFMKLHDFETGNISVVGRINN